jgi:hypothetical protein
MVTHENQLRLYGQYYNVFLAAQIWKIPVFYKEEACVRLAQLPGARKRETR